MNRFCVAALALLAVAANGPTQAAAVTAQPTADEIVAKHVAARGGTKSIRAIASLRQTGKVIAGAGREALFTRELARPARTRFEFTLQGVTAVFVSDGQHGWKSSPFDGEFGVVPLPQEAVDEAAEQADIEGPLVDWKVKGYQLELAGRETVDGAETYKLKLTLKSGGVQYHYIDVKTSNLVRTDSTRQVRGKAVPFQVSFGEFKKTGGVVFPRRIDVVAVGRPGRLRLLVSKVEVNPSLADARFAAPAS